MSTKYPSAATITARLKFRDGAWQQNRLMTDLQDVNLAFSQKTIYTKRAEW